MERRFCLPEFEFQLELEGALRKPYSRDFYHDFVRVKIFAALQRVLFLPVYVISSTVSTTVNKRNNIIDRQRDDGKATNPIEGG